MNLPRIFLLVILILGTDLVAYGQVLQEPILVDEYSYLAPCDDLLGRLDGYLSELQHYPDQSGVIVLRNTPANRPSSAILQALIESWLDYREFDRRRITFVRADANQQSRQFWRIPAGARNPSVERVIPGFQMSEEVTKPFLLVEQPRYGPNICPAIDEFSIFAGFLKDNPTARGNVVVRAASPTIARRKAAQILRKLRSTQGVRHKRLRIFTAGFERSSNRDEAVVEYWYLP